MSYLVPTDYSQQITDVTIQQIISGNEYLKTTGEARAIQEIKSYLAQKFDVDAEFVDMLLYNPSFVDYKAGNRVYLDATAYNPAVTYALNVLALYSGKVYRCTTAIAVAEAFTPGHWELLGNQYDIFYASYPQPLFNLQSFYRVDDLTFWKGHIYKCLVQTSQFSHDATLQYSRLENIPFGNVFPDDRTVGASHWHDEGAYSIAANKLLDTTIFTKGDNRNGQLVTYLVDILLYRLYGRIAPKAIPEERKNRFDAAIAWLRMAAKGDVMPAIQKLQPPQGMRIRSGGKIKNVNDY
jgi:hypothetical protein